VGQRVGVNGAPAGSGTVCCGSLIFQRRPTVRFGHISRSAITGFVVELAQTNRRQILVKLRQKTAAVLGEPGVDGTEPTNG